MRISAKKTTFLWLIPYDKFKFCSPIGFPYAMHGDLLTIFTQKEVLPPSFLLISIDLYWDLH